MTHQFSAKSAVDPVDDVLIDTAMLRRRWANCSEMKIWRRSKDDPDFPKPLYMSRRKLWWLSKIIQYERVLESRGAPNYANAT